MSRMAASNLRNVRSYFRTTGGDFLISSRNCSITVSRLTFIGDCVPSCSVATRILGRSKSAEVHKLWSGLRKELQRDLSRDKRNPQVLSLKEFVASVEVLEIAQSIAGEKS